MPTDKVFVLYSKKCANTGRAIVKGLKSAGVNASGGFESPSDTNCNLIRWGTSAKSKMFSGNVFNKREAIGRATDKLVALSVLSKARIPVPVFGEDLAIFDNLPILWRGRNHHAGNKFRMIKTLKEYREEVKRGQTEGYYMDFINKAREYRIYATTEEVIICYEKLKTKDVTCPYRWNRDFGYSQEQCKRVSKNTSCAMILATRCIKTLGLDFGAVDIVETKDGKLYVIEVNTGPTLGDFSLPIILEKMTQIVGLDPTKYDFSAVEQEDIIDDDDDE